VSRTLKLTPRAPDADAAREAGRIRKALVERHGKDVRIGIVHVRMLGNGRRMTPGNERPATVSATFDMDKDSPIDAARNAAHKWHGQQTEPEQWNVIAEYTVDPKAARFAPYERVFVLRNDHPFEVKMRAHYGFTDEVLNPFESDYPSWYLSPVTAPTTI